MQRYASENALPLTEIFAEDRSPVDALTELFIFAARQYTRDTPRRGCMVIEGMRANDQTARDMAVKLAKPGNDAIRGYYRRSSCQRP